MELARQIQVSTCGGGRPLVARRPRVDAWTYCASPNFLNFLNFFFWKFGKWARAFGRMGVQHPHFLKLPLHSEVLNLSFLMEIGDFTFFQILFFLNLEYTYPLYLLLGFLFHEKLRSLKIPQDFLVLWKCFVSFFSAGCIWVCSTHHLHLRFDTQVPNMMRITMVQKLKVA
jgi:hypothetical protein